MVKSDLAMETLPQADADQIAALAEGNTAFASAFYALLQKMKAISFSHLLAYRWRSVWPWLAQKNTEEVMMNALG